MTTSGFFHSHYFLLTSKLIETRFFSIFEGYHDGYHELCNWKTLLCEINDPVVTA